MFHWKSVALVVITVCSTYASLPSRCKLPKVTGPCRAAFPRYYYNKGQGKCLKFIYGGCQGNANNFKTLGDCEKACKVSSRCELPKVTGPCKARFPRYYYNQNQGKCLKFIYGGCQGNANNFKTLGECEDACKANNPCNVPKKIGPCDAEIPRYFYNRKTGDCENFMFGGCEANANNFETLKACRSTCVVSSPCILPKVVGPCEALIPRFYYDQSAAQCLDFSYGGCQGNSNNFETLKQCEKKCECRSRCFLPKVQGPCYANFPRYFYNKVAGQCQPFVYGGCFGNGNNFMTLAECNAICRPNHY